MKKLSAPLAFVLSVLLIESSAVLAQLSVTPAEWPLIERIQGREFPSVFQAWSPAQNVEDDSPLHTVARHDLVFNEPEFFGLRWNRKPTGLADGFTAESVGRAKSFRQRLLTLNPNLVLVAEIRYRDAQRTYLTEGHKANSDGTVLREFENGTVVYNPMGNKVVSVAFPEERRSAATGKVARSHDLGSPDGDFFLKVK